MYKKLAYSSGFYALLGLLAGLFYREFTKIQAFTGKTQLAVVHTHTLTLGMIGFLLFLVVFKQFDLPETKMVRWFYYLYHAGLLLTVAMLMTQGILTVLGKNVSPAISGIAGLGHIILTIALGLFFHILFKQIKKIPQ